MGKTIHQKTEDLFKEVGEFGSYQLFVFVLVGLISIIPAIVGYSYSFYGATPNYRCQIPGIENDTYEIQNDYHQNLIDKYIPLSSDKSFKDVYDKCNFKFYANQSFNDDNQMRSIKNYTLTKCNKWVYSKKYFENTLITKWNLVCKNSTRRSLFSTLYFVGTYGVILSGILSDKLGRKKTAYIFVIANAIFNISLSFLISYDMEDTNTQQILFGIIRFFCGIASNVYAVCVVIAIEIVGPSKRVTAANTIYYIFILGEFLVLFLAYFIRNYVHFYISCTALMSLFVLFFWLVPESPRWLMTKGKYHQAFLVFQKIAKSNKKDLQSLTELDDLKSTGIKNRKKDDNTISPINEMLNTPEEVKQKTYSTIETLKIFFKSTNLIIRSSVLLLNWLTNTLVYYGISFNTTELVGDPYLNFGLSVLVELIAIISTHVTLERYGRKIPYSINMALTGISLLFVLFIPKDLGSLVTVCALIGKFSISFTYNTIYIITAESHPTVIRNSSVSICQSFARMGAIIAPNIQLLGEIYWYPIPFIVYGGFSTLSAILFIFFMPETKFKKLPDTIEEFIQF